MGYRINERNTGSYSLEENTKQRRYAKSKKLTDEEKAFAKEMLQRIYDCMELEQGVGFTDGGRFILCLKRDQMTMLREITEKL